MSENKVTWWQLTEAQRESLATLCEVGGGEWCPSPCLLMSLTNEERNFLRQSGLIQERIEGEFNSVLERATAAGLEVYKQRNAAPVIGNGERFKFVDGKFERITSGNHWLKDEIDLLRIRMAELNCSKETARYVIALERRLLEIERKLEKLS